MDTAGIFRKFRRPATQAPPAIRMPDVTAWAPLPLTVVAPDPATWPFGGDRHLPQGGPPNGWWVMYVLDTETGELTVRTNQGRWPQGPDCSHGRGGYDDNSGVWVQDYLWDRTPRRIGFPRRCYGDSLPFDVAARDLALIAPRAERLLASLQPVPGTSEWDWTVEAIIAHHIIRYSILTSEDTDEDRLARMEAQYADRFPWAISFSDLIGLYPELHTMWPALAAMPDSKLDELAARLTRTSAPPMPPVGLLARDDRPVSDEWYGRIRREPGYEHPYVVSARAGLYRLRTQRAREATGYPAADAARFLAANPGLWPPLTADMTDAAMEQAAADLHARTAGGHHVALTGALAALTGERARLRAAVRAELEQAGRDTAAADQHARRLRTARAALTGRVIAWQDPADYDQGTLRTADLARRAAMPEQDLIELQARLEEAGHAGRAGD